MKNKKIKNLLRVNIVAAIGVILFLFNSCSVSQVPLEILVPAQINIDKNIKNIGIINRSLPERRRKVINFLEGFISGESIMADRVASEYCLKGLAETLNNSPRFNAVIISGENLRGTGTRSFPIQMDWGRVKRICEKYRVDALVALETFDSNIYFDIDKRRVKRKIKDKKTKKKITIISYVYDALLNIDVNSGWRIYNPFTRTIVDMNIYRDRKSWNSSGDTPREAKRRMPRKREAINISGYNSGIMYGMRISPSWINVNRDFYVKGSPELKEAKRYVRSDNWTKAIDIWKSLLNNSDKKIAGRASYNLAFASEVKGKFNEAYKWAKISYEKFGNKRAFSYIQTLRNRISDKYRLEEQLDEN